MCFYATEKSVKVKNRLQIYLFLFNKKQKTENSENFHTKTDFFGKRPCLTEKSVKCPKKRAKKAQCKRLLREFTKP